MNNAGLAGWLFILISITSFWRCANEIAPRGGEEDNEPPKIDTLKSAPNYTTNFDGNQLRITFDEWVKLNDAFNQIIISPPQDAPPEVKLKGKTVVLTFRDTLLANTTYSVFFGESVKDITKGNSAKDLRYVFSTGAVIDSLEVGGSVVDASSGDPVEDILVMLYKRLEDSIVYKEKPLYFAKTNKSGSFNISNISDGQYLVFGLKDNNFNYRYDLPNEKIAFSQAPLIINDSTKSQVKLLLFEEDRPLRKNKVQQISFGKVRFEFNSPPNNVIIRSFTDAQKMEYAQTVRNDSIYFWYDLPQGDSMTLLLEDGSNLMDTVGVRIKNRQNFLASKPRIKPVFKSIKTAEKAKKGGFGLGENSKKSSAIKPLEIHPNKPLFLTFDYPIKSFDASKITLKEDSSKTGISPQIELDSSDKMALKIIHKWRPGALYSLHFKQKSLFSIVPVFNDSIGINLEVKQKEDFGKILSEVQGLDVTTHYIIQLLNSEDELLDSYQVSGQSAVKKDYSDLIPGKYSLKVIEDLNNNGRWDPGNYLEKRMPERISIRELPPLKANWEVEGKVNIGEKSELKKGKGGIKK